MHTSYCRAALDASSTTQKGKLDRPPYRQIWHLVIFSTFPKVNTAININRFSYVSHIQTHMAKILKSIPKD